MQTQHGIAKPAISASDDKSSGRRSEKSIDDDDLRYECFGRHPNSLQWMNNIGGVVAFISLSNCFINLSNALYGVILSTVEKRFDLSSSQSSWIASGYEIGPIPVLIVLSYFASRVHRPRSVGIGLLSATLGCILFFIPHFTAPPYLPNNNDQANEGTCRNRSGETPCDDPKVSLSYYLPIFIIARLLIGMGSTPTLSVGVNFMNDCSTKEKFATYAGIFNAMSVVGPALGFVLGGLMLNIFSDFYSTDSNELGLDPSDSQWIGAWWLPYIIAAILCLLNAVPMFGYQNDLPGAAAIREAQVTEAHNNQITGDNIQMSYAKSFKEFKTLVKDVFSNPTFIFLTIFTAADNFIISGFTAFGPKLVQYAFSMSAALAGGIFGIVLLPAGAFGTIIGGVIIEKMRLSCKQIIRVELVMSAIVTVTVFLFLLYCDTLSFAGVNAPYNASFPENSYNLTVDCNVNCDCAEVRYEPVCSHDNIQYYSPCHAGCTLEYTGGETKEYFNCSCVSLAASNSFIQDVTSGECSAPTCAYAWVFMAGFFVGVLFIFVCLTMNMSATLRCITSSQAPFAYSVQILILKLLGTIPGPIFIGLAFDNTCSLWQYNCGEKGSCMFYSTKDLALNLFIITFTVKLISLFAMILAAVFYKPPVVVESTLEVTNKPAINGTVSTQGNPADSHDLSTQAPWLSADDNVDTSF